MNRRADARAARRRRGAVRPRRHAGRHGRRPRRRAQPRARATAGCAPVPVDDAARATRRPARAGCSAPAWASRPTHAELRGAARRVSRRTTPRASRRRRSCSTASATLLDAIEARGLAWGIVTNKAARYTGPVVAALALAHARRRDRVRRHDAASQAASRAAAARGGRAARCRRRAASTSATTCATSRPATRPACRRSSRATATWAPASDPTRVARAPAGSIDAARLLDWLPLRRLP